MEPAGETGLEPATPGFGVAPTSLQPASVQVNRRDPDPFTPTRFSATGTKSGTKFQPPQTRQPHHHDCPGRLCRGTEEEAAGLLDGYLARSQPRESRALQ